MYVIRWSSKFKKDVRKCQKQGKNMELFKAVNDYLIQSVPLPQANRDHLLTGEWKGHRECHIMPDWLLIYRIIEEEGIIEYIRMGSHSDLFR